MIDRSLTLIYVPSIQILGDHIKSNELLLVSFDVHNLTSRKSIISYYQRMTIDDYLSLIKFSTDVIIREILNMLRKIWSDAEIFEQTYS